MVKCFKLINGEEIVAESEKNGSAYKLTNAVKFVPTQKGLGMLPFLPLLAGDTFEIDERHVMIVCDIDPELINAYKSQFGGIVAAPANSIPKIHIK